MPTQGLHPHPGPLSSSLQGSYLFPAADLALAVAILGKSLGPGGFWWPCTALKPGGKLSVIELQGQNQKSQQQEVLAAAPQGTLNSCG